ncbi:Alanine aminotransferase 1 [Hypsibius exemplaris]|uniref:alanine transaminase n=1 Tax=Hypsibius exemplaris TaxID=2072580 RepID=A0A9X6NK06_HYPEX|nr:Alanine aminotransferase 1 [Hypsibius exemplaris]
MSVGGDTTGGAQHSRKVLSLQSMNANIRAMQYAVLGPMEVRARQLELELKQGTGKPFDSVIRANIGDCHAMDQIPVTYIRQVLGLCLNNSLLTSPDFPEDAKDHARRILSACRGHSLGSYTEGVGIDIIHRSVADFIQRRDGGVQARPKDVIITEGATEGIINILKMLNQPRDGKPTGVLVPVPQYPLYSATLTEFAMAQVNYSLDEEHNWALDIAELKRAIDECRSRCNPAAIVVINPGNPTGQVLTEENIRDVIRFAQEEGLFLIADEVYQDNVYGKDSTFHSFKKVMMQMGSPYYKMELASFYTASKGLVGECGLRGAFMEVINMDPDVRAMLTKLFTVSHPNTVGQVCIDCAVNPPKPGDPSYATFTSEREGILVSLAERAQLVTDAFNSIPGVQCNEVQGSMFAFPRLDLPAKLISQAKRLGQEPDYFYASQLLEHTGVFVVPGSGFGQKPGTFHFRTTILPSPELLKKMVQRFRVFHEKFIQSFM